MPRVVPATSRSFEEMRDTLRDAVTRARAAVHVQELVNTLEDELAGGASVNDAATKLNLPVKRVAAVDAMGLMPDGMKADVPAQPVFLEQIFGLEEGIESDPFRVDEDNIYVARVTNVTPSALKPLDQVRAEVQEGWETQTRQEALQRRAGPNTGRRHRYHPQTLRRQYPSSRVGHCPLKEASAPWAPAGCLRHLQDGTAPLVHPPRQHKCFH